MKLQSPPSINTNLEETKVAIIVWKLYLVSLLSLLFALIIAILFRVGTGHQSAAFIIAFFLALVGYLGAVITSIMGIIVYKRKIRKAIAVGTVIICGLLTLAPFLSVL